LQLINCIYLIAILVTKTRLHVR